MKKLFLALIVPLNEAIVTYVGDLGDLVAALKELHAMGDLRASLESLVASG